MSDPIQFSPPEPSELSELLGGYEVTSLIATGGMGAVYGATQISLDRPVAIKLLPKEFGDTSFREQFQAEARAMAKLNHVNLIGIYDYGDANGMPYIVMELVAGKSLYHSSYNKAIDQTAAVEIIIGICRGLSHAHDAGIIHRDIKPSNILLDPSAKPKIGDFGLASAMDQDHDSDSPVFGTPGYAAPEILASAKAIGIPSDLYAVGVILYQLLTGKMPEEPASPPSSMAKCDARLDPVFKKATRRNPSLRYQSATDLADGLQALLPTLGTGGQRAMKTGSEREKPPGVTLKRRLTTDSPQSSDKSDPAKPKLVPLPKGDSAPASVSRTKLRPLPEAAPKDAVQVAVPPAVSVETSSNWPIIRNLLIIAALIPIIIFTWGLYEKKQDRIKKEKDAEKLEEKNKDIERKAQNELERRDAAERERVAAEAVVRRERFEKERMAAAALEAAKTPMERLEEFRANLYSGRRDQFPDGTIDRSTHFLFCMESPMTWSEAAEFAELHGGHLATPSTQPEIDVLVKRMGGDLSQVWIGGGATGINGWSWVNGEPWTYKEPGTILGSCAALTSSSVIKARPNAEKNPFVIQWSKDGSNSGSVAAQLARLVPTFDSPSPAWPPTTVSHENRAFFFVHKSVSWDEADLIASSSDGHLAVVSKPLEGIFIRDYLQNALSPQQSAWLGGRLDDGAWTWSTGEVWAKASWAPNSPDGGASDSALCYVQAPGAEGWDDVSPRAGSTQGFLIEWSNDAESNAPAGKTAATGAKELAKLRSIGRRLVGKEVSDFEKALIGNRDFFSSTVNTWFELLSKNNKAPYAAAFKALQENLPADGDLTGEMNLGNLPAKVHGEHAKGLERQAVKKKAFDEKLIALRQNYLKKLLAMRDTYEKGGLETQVGSVDTEIEAIGQDGESLRSHFGK